jgi:hypothetical protein
MMPSRDRFDISSRCATAILLDMEDRLLPGSEVAARIGDRRG